MVFFPIVLSFLVSSLMVYFIFQFDWAMSWPAFWLNMISGCVFDGVSERDLYLDSGLSKAQGSP